MFYEKFQFSFLHFAVITLRLFHFFFFFLEIPVILFVFLLSWLKTCRLLLFEPSGRKSKNSTSTSSRCRKKRKLAATGMVSCKPRPLSDITEVRMRVHSVEPVTCRSLIRSRLLSESSQSRRRAACLPVLLWGRRVSLASGQQVAALPHTDGSFKLCVSGVYADKVGIEAAEMLLRNIRHNGCVDEFLQDQVSRLRRRHHEHTHAGMSLWPLPLPPPQLIIFMALAKGTSRIRTGAVTLHTQTAIHIAEQLTQVRTCSIHGGWGGKWWYA